MGHLLLSLGLVGPCDVGYGDSRGRVSVSKGSLPSRIRTKGFGRFISPPFGRSCASRVKMPPLNKNVTEPCIYDIYRRWGDRKKKSLEINYPIERPNVK